VRPFCSTLTPAVITRPVTAAPVARPGCAAPADSANACGTNSKQRTICRCAVLF
jgi:hypothetical protein